MKKNKKTKMKRFILCFCMLLTSGFLIFQGFKVIYTTYSIQKNIEVNKEKSMELDEKKEKLEDEKKNLSNPDYIEYVARGKYLVTKQGEQVFKFPTLETDDE